MGGLGILAAACSLLVGGPAKPLPLPTRFRPPRMQSTTRLTVTLRNCEGGVGVGLDKSNVVDMLVPGSPASMQLSIGDKVILWNGNLLLDSSGAQIKLVDAVVPGLEHTLVIERPSVTELTASSPPAKPSETQAEWEEQTEWKGDETWKTNGGSDSTSGGW